MILNEVVLNNVYKQELKKAFFAMLIYIVWVVLALIFDKMIPSGPCTPGGIMFLFLIPIVAVTMLSLSIYKLIRFGKSHRTAFIIHLIICLIIGAFILIH